MASWLLTPVRGRDPRREWESLEYFDWKSGGDTNFAPLASADGELECRGFWDKGKPDKDALWTTNADKAPTLRRYVESIGANFGRVRIIKLEPQPLTRRRSAASTATTTTALNPEGEGWVVRSWIELTDDPDSYMLLMDLDEDRLPIASTERRVPSAQELPVRGRHAASVARRRAPRRPAALRAHHLCRVHACAGRLDPEPGAGPRLSAARRACGALDSVGASWAHSSC
jgi:hypothetical protein